MPRSDEHDRRAGRPLAHETAAAAATRQAAADVTINRAQTAQRQPPGAPGRTGRFRVSADSPTTPLACRRCPVPRAPGIHGGSGAPVVSAVLRAPVVGAEGVVAAVAARCRCTSSYPFPETVRLITLGHADRNSAEPFGPVPRVSVPVTPVLAWSGANRNLAICASGCRRRLKLTPVRRMNLDASDLWRVIKLDDWAEIRRLRRAEQLPIKEIARRWGIARNTVRAALASDTPPRYRRGFAVS